MTRFVLISLVVVGLVSVAGCQSHTAEIKAATQVTDAWLKLIDQGSYGEGWDQTGAPFKQFVPRDQWTKQVEAIRIALGPLVSRTVKHSEYTTHLSGRPEGEYVILQYSTSFKNRNGMVEEITSTKEKDGGWVPLGYYIK